MEEKVVKNEQIALRASQMPLAFKCPGSVHGDGLRIDNVVDESNLGTAVHAVLAHMVKNHLEDVPDLSPFRKKYGLENDEEFQLLCWYGWKAWQELKEFFPNPSVEKYLETAIISGHVDVWCDPAITPILLDWKSGRLDTDAYNQIASYCYMSAEWDSNFFEGKTYTGIAVYLREQYYRKYTFTAEELLEWGKNVTTEVMQWDGVFHVGSHCRFCRRQSECPARRGMIVSTVEALTCGNSVNGYFCTSKHASATRNELGPSIGDLYERVKAVEAMTEQFRDWIRTDIAANGPLPVGEGKVLTLMDRSKDTIEPLPAWDIITEQLTADELAPCLKISKTSLLQVISDKAQRGQKKQAKEAFMAELEKAGAVTKSTYQVLGYQEKENEVK